MIISCDAYTNKNLVHIEWLYIIFYKFLKKIEMNFV